MGTVDLYLDESMMPYSQGRFVVSVTYDFHKGDSGSRTCPPSADWYEPLRAVVLKNGYGEEWGLPGVGEDVLDQLPFSDLDGHIKAIVEANAEDHRTSIYLGQFDDMRDGGERGESIR